MKKMFCILSVLALFTGRQVVADAAPADVDALKKENAELRQRLEKVEGELGEIKQMLQERAPAPAAPAPTPGLTQEDVAKLKEMAALKGKPVRSSLDLKFYGYVKLDAAYDDSRTCAGNYARWVECEASLDNDNQFSMTANQTRLGVDITGPETGSLKTSGKVEIDFYGAGMAENKPEPLLRHAYLNVAWPDWDFSLLAGQASDVISPLWMPTVNYTVGWWQGNIGYRRPQIRLTKELPVADDVKLKLELAAARTITGRKFIFTGSTDPDSGSDTGWPTVQGRTSLSFPCVGKRPATLGFSGHYGQEEQLLATDGRERHIDTWSGNVDVRVPMTDWLLVQAEGFIGEDLDAYLGGIGLGYDTNTVSSVRAMGGWVAATLTPAKKWEFNTGAGIDDVRNADVSAGEKLSNYVLFGNAYYSLTANLQLALELSYLRTTYKKRKDGDDVREQLAVIYKF